MSLKLVVPFELATPAGEKRSTGRLPVERRTLPEKPVLGLIDNRKIKADRLLRAIGEALQRRGAISSYFVHHKAGASVSISDEERDAILAKADIVIAGLGDCGGCTACSVADALRCLAAGAPAFMLATEKFAFLVEATEREYGLEGLDRLYVGHPVWSRDDAWFDDVAEALADRWQEALRSGASVETQTAPKSASVAEALAELTAAMDADGYDLGIAQADGDVVITVTAREGVCGTCLIPPAAFARMAHRSLDGAGLGIPLERLQVNYPAAANA